MRRPFPADFRFLAPVVRVAVVLLAFCAAATALSACATPGAIGVQDTGTIQGRLVDAQTNLPIANALVSVGSLYTVHSDPSGVFQLTCPTGDQTVLVQANGYVYTGPTLTVTVVKDMTVNVGGGAIALQPTNP